jgi:hypothetical protein
MNVKLCDSCAIGSAPLDLGSDANLHTEGTCASCDAATSVRLYSLKELLSDLVLFRELARATQPNMAPSDL